MSTPKRAFGSSAKTRNKDVTLDLPTARQMLPLVKIIVKDIVDCKDLLTKLEPEQESLDRHRHDLVWKERDRRYAIHDEMANTENTLKRAVAELKDLGLDLVDDHQGRIAFPTRINGRPAVFSWQLGEENVDYWSYEEEEMRRPIPGDWVPGTPLRLKNKL